MARPLAIEPAHQAALGKTTLLVVKSQPCEVAFLSSRVRLVDDAAGTSMVLDLERALGLDAPPSDSMRVLLLSGSRGAFRVRTRARLDVRDVLAEERLALPAVVRRASPFAELVLSGGVASILVLDVDALEALAE